MVNTRKATKSKRKKQWQQQLLTFPKMSYKKSCAMQRLLPLGMYVLHCQCYSHYISFLACAAFYILVGKVFPSNPLYYLSTGSKQAEQLDYLAIGVRAIPTMVLFLKTQTKITPWFSLAFYILLTSVRISMHFFISSFGGPTPMCVNKIRCYLKK